MSGPVALSICIPVYNSRPYELLHSILRQLPHLPKGTEIRVADDGSAPENRAEVEKYCHKHGIDYHQEPRNVGRAAIRNILMQKSKGEWLLFLDNDAIIPDGHYLKNYYSYRLNGGVVCGGVHYLPPAQSGCELRHRYGLIRECKPAAERAKNPYNSFKTNNFLAHNSVFTQVQFDESLKNYGHEDTLFGLQLAQKKIAIQHVNMPTHHAVSDTNERFLKKSKAALHNLKYIAQNYPELRSQLALYNLAYRLRKMGLALLYLKWAALKKPQWERQLLNGTASMRIFDLYRLLKLLELGKRLEKPETRNQKPETRNQRPETRNIDLNNK